MTKVRKPPALMTDAHWMKILCSWACAAYCQNCEPNSHALRAQTVVLRSDAMRAHSRIFKQMLILSCAPAAFYVMWYKKSWHLILKDLRYNQEDKESGQNGRKQTIWPWIQSTGGETEQYVNSHLEYAGCSQTIFTEKALDEIYRISTGIPRMINRVCEKTLMYAFQKQNRLIDDYMVKYVADHELING